MAKKLKWQHVAVLVSSSVPSRLSDEEIDLDTYRPKNCKAPKGWKVSSNRWGLWHIRGHDRRELGSMTLIWRRMIQKVG